MKKVKFNACTSILMIPENKYAEYKEKMDILYDDDYEAFVMKVRAGTRFQFKDVNIGDVVEVPNWYYDSQKERTVTLPVSFDKYKDKNGGRLPFNTEEAVRHGDMKDLHTTIKKIKLFELIEDLDEKKSVKAKV